MTANAHQSPPSWLRGPLDLIAHAASHYRETTESARRHALIGFDQAVEGTITAYSRSETRVPTDAALAHRAGFWAKVRYLEAVMQLLGERLPLPIDDVTRIHDRRNELYHSGAWIVPTAEEVDTAYLAASAVVAVLSGGDHTTYFRPLRQSTLEEASGSLQGSRRLTGKRGGRLVAEQALEIARSVDPEREGIHYTRMARLLTERAQWAGEPLTVYWALNRAHDLFIRPAPGIYVWRSSKSEASESDLRGTSLADVALNVAQLVDPRRKGLHYNRELKPAIVGAGHTIAGPDAGATLNNALRADPRFTRTGRGTYVWVKG